MLGRACFLMFALLVQIGALTDAATTNLPKTNNQSTAFQQTNNQ